MQKREKATLRYKGALCFVILFVEQSQSQPSGYSECIGARLEKNHRCHEGTKGDQL